MTGSLYLGLISGTSRDGADVALVRLEGDMPDLIAAHCVPYPEPLLAGVDRVVTGGRRPDPGSTRALDEALGAFFSDACLSLLAAANHDPGEVRAIGAHGQTVWHEPGGDDPISLQLGNPAVIAARTGIAVVSDFRSPDLAAGGEGAPLAPLLHRALFRSLAPCAVLNLGGIANLTFLGRDGGVRGFDTGPASCLMDEWCRRHRGEPFDDRGRWAAGGEAIPELLAALLDDPWFELPPPKSTGLELFNADWLGRALTGNEAPRDVQRTLLELTVATVAGGLQTLAPAGTEPPNHVLVCGGGVHNDFLMARLRDSLGGVAVESTAAHGVEPDWVEATLFAWLARERLAGRAQDTPPITGARTAVRLGAITPVNDPEARP